MADDSSDGSDKDRNAATVRDMKGPVLSSDTMPDVVGVYAPPRPLPEVSQHRTVDLKSIRISDYADPRRALTERRLVSPPRPPQRSALAWSAAVLAGAAVLGGTIWLVLGRPSSTLSPSPAAPRGSASPSALAAPIVAPLNPPPAATTPSSSAASPAFPTPVLDASAMPPQKASRPRESTKKRKDPWLE
jgi:hypothetical protein